MRASLLQTCSTFVRVSISVREAASMSGEVVKAEDTFRELKAFRTNVPPPRSTHGAHTLIRVPQSRAHHS